MSNQKLGIDWSKAITAGAVATVVMTLLMAIVFKTDIMKGIGSMIVGSDGGVMTYIVGGIMHFMVGIVYGIVFAFIAPKVPLPSIATGLVFGLVLTPIAVIGMPIMMNMAGGGDGENPCGGSNPCASTIDNWTPISAPQENPCNPCASNPCQASNPCAENPCEGVAQNPCNPCSASNPCEATNPCDASNPCGAGNPCGGGEANPWPSSTINHLAFGLVLGLMYKPKAA